MQTLDFILNGAETKRFHTWPTLREDRVDSHAFRVAMICAVIAQSAEPVNGQGLTLPLIMAALTHDLAEHKLGDLPAPAKRDMPPMQDGMSFRTAWGLMELALLTENSLDWEPLLSEKEQHWLKLADAMDGALFCTRERMMGNKLMETPYHNFISYIVAELWVDEEPIIHDIVGYIYDMWEQANG